MRERADKVIFQQGLSRSRNEAQDLIERGLVFYQGQAITAPSVKIPADAQLEILDHDAYVSRGAYKLKAALDHFAIKPEGKVALDLGISTGGFTDILLRYGAAKIYGIDVGEGQLSPRLKDEPRLVLWEKTHVRHLSSKMIPEKIDLITCDLSFISLKSALPAALALAASEAFLIALIKPQFEVGRQRIGKGGIVRDQKLHQEVCQSIEAWLAAQNWRVLGFIPSPILGGSGNKEFLIAAQKGN